MRVGSLTFTRREIFDIGKAWLLLSLAFGIALHGLSLKASLLVAIVISLLTVGIGFVLHELAHKYVAHRYHLHAEFFANNMMLVFALVTSVFGLILAAPGAVWIEGTSRDKHGKIALAGPLTNILLALVFIVVYFLVPSTLSAIAAYGFQINAFLALFNMLPFFGFDGVQVLAWSKKWYGISMAGAVLVTAASYAITIVV